MQNAPSKEVNEEGEEEDPRQELVEQSAPASSTVLTAPNASQVRGLQLLSVLLPGKFPRNTLETV